MKFTPDNRSLIADPKVEFAFDSVSLAMIGDLISAVDHCTQALKDHKPIGQADSLLKALQAEAANDSNKNDVAYLSERRDFESSVLSDEDMNDVDAALTLSIEDLERVFIQNLSNLLIQRMHSLERFSAPDQKIGINGIKTWDLVFDKVAERFSLIVDGPDEDWVSSIVFPSGRFFGGTSVHFHTNSFRGHAMRTITEDELEKCRKAMEATHA